MNKPREQSSSLVMEQAPTTDQVQHHSIEPISHDISAHGDSDQQTEILYPKYDGELPSGWKVPFDNFDIYHRV